MNIGVQCTACNCRTVKPSVPGMQCAIPTQLTSSNEPLLPAEENYLRNFLQNDVGPKKVAVVGIISNVEKLLHAWKENLADLDASLALGKAVLSPIRRLPAETLGEIITHYMDMELSEKANAARPRHGSLDVKRGLWLLSRVSRRWRAVVVSLSSAWARITISYNDARPPSPEILKTILERSGQQALRLQLHISSDSTSARDFLGLFAAHSKRWGDVTLILNPKLFPRLKKLQNNVPRLQAIHIQSITSSGRAVVTKLVQCFEVAPALRRVTFSGLHPLQTLKIPWSSLTHFDDGGRDTCKYQPSILRQMPNLVSLTISFFPENQNETTEVLELRHVKYFSTMFSLPIKSLRLPALEEVEIDSLAIRDLTDLVRRSGCSLKHLKLHPPLVIGDPAGPFNSFLREIPQLDILDIAYLDAESVDKLFDIILGETDVIPLLRQILVTEDLLESPKTIRRITSTMRSRRFMREVIFTPTIKKGDLRFEVYGVVPVSMKDLRSIPGTKITFLGNRPKLGLDV
ncbi:hypothetical protein C8J56DRAFT_386100 [Mycena floridula]|nr:hypothetical protein C8J56DRAFT_386100 [Mycena floridula]